MTEESVERPDTTENDPWDENDPWRGEESGRRSWSSGRRRGEGNQGPSTAHGQPSSSQEGEPRSRTFAVTQPQIEPLAQRIIHDVPPVWDGKDPDNQAEPYLKLLAG